MIYIIYDDLLILLFTITNRNALKTYKELLKMHL